VTRVKDLETRIERLEQQLGVYQRISRLMVRELSLSETLQAVVRLVTEFTNCDSCLLYLIQDEQLVLCSSSNPHPLEIGNVRLGMNEGLTGWVAKERKMLAISQEAYKDTRFKAFSDLPEDSFEAFLSVPVIARNRVIGVINIQHRMPHRHSGAEMEMITTVGEQVGCLIALARLSGTAIDDANHVDLVRRGVPVGRQSAVRKINDDDGTSGDWQ
jgi:signal transduction protein with GAF and PtsI domain